MSNYKPIYIDLNTGNKFYLDSPVDSPVAVFKFTQTTPSSSWVVSHNMHTTKFIVIVNNDDNSGINDILIVDDDNISISFSSLATGHATLIIFE